MNLIIFKRVSYWK